jgi:tight adherence protein B
MGSVGEIGMIENYRQYHLSQKERILCWSMLAAGALLLGWLFYKSFLPVLMVPMLSKTITTRYQRLLVTKRQLQLRLQFRDLLHSMTASFATGRQLKEALNDGCARLSDLYGEGSLLKNELRAMISMVEESGASPTRLFRDLGFRSGVSEIRQFSDTCEICIETGGDLEKAAGKAINILIDRIEVEEAIRSMTAQKRYEIKILSAIPCILLMCLQLTSSGYIDALYTSTAGRMLMTASLLLVAGAYLWSILLLQSEV